MKQFSSKYLELLILKSLPLKGFSMKCILICLNSIHKLDSLGTLLCFKLHFPKSIASFTVLIMDGPNTK
jgi:hypothetical protein